MPGWSDAHTGEDKLRAVIARQLEQVMAEKRWEPLPHQVPPVGDWLGWLLVAGRGAGKSAAASHFVVEHVHGPPCIPGPTPHWMAIIAPTLGDAATSCYSGPAGIRSFDPDAVMGQKIGGQVVTWPNGSQAKMYGAREPDDVERLRAGGNTCLCWLEEIAAWRYMEDAWDQIRFGLRLGDHPRWIGTTTPKPRPLIKRLVKGDFRRVVLGTATTYDNPHLPQHIKDALEEAYQGTSLGSQELLGRLVEQDENALWTREIIELNRVPAQEDLQRIAVGVDPSGGAGEQGIVVIGCQTQLTTVTTSPEAPPRLLKHGYVLDDRTVHLQPAGWGRAAVQAAVDWDADAVVVETNFGGDMAVSTIVTAAEDMGIHVPVKTVRASRGKHPRAQPVSALAVQRRWHHAGTFLALEDQLCTWTEDADWSPDRLDAMAWPAWYLKMISTVVKQVGTFGGSDLVRRTIGRRRSS